LVYLTTEVSSDLQEQVNRNFLWRDIVSPQLTNRKNNGKISSKYLGL